MCKWKTKMSETATYILQQICDGQKVFILEDKSDAALTLVKGMCAISYRWSYSFLQDGRIVVISK